MPRLKVQNHLKILMKEYYQSLSSPIAWCTSAGPAEVLRGLGFDVYFPENHGALLGASRTAQKYIPLAQREGYGKEICSYLTADIGAYLAGETPLSAAYGLKSVPKPDLIVYNTNQCREVSEWFNFYGRKLDTAVVGIYPPRYLEEIRDKDIEQVMEQFEHLIAVGEQVIGKPMDEDQFRETVNLSQQGSALWKKILETARNVPSPLTFFDGTILMAPIVVMRGTQECIDFYRLVLDELEERVRNGIGAVENEEVRIYWDGMPIWGRLRFLAELFSENDACIVASTYCNSWIFDDLDVNEPLRSLALAYTRIFINRGENYKLSYFKEMVEKYKVDGMIFHDSKTCFNNTNSRFGLPERVEEEIGIPTLVIEGDLNDLRFFSDAQTQTKIETFIEQLKG